MSGFADLLKPVGPKAEAFVKDKRLLTGIMGPPGSAKSTMCIRKIVFESPLWQVPGPDGVIRVRWACVRATFPQLQRTAIKSWGMWFPMDRNHWNQSTMTHTMRYQLVDAATGAAVTVELEMIFIALNDLSADEVLPGLELTGLWLNEINTLPMRVWLIGAGRTGRYPPAKFGGCTWSGVIADMNAPDFDSWTYELLVEGNFGLDDETEKLLREQLGPRFGVGFYRQPGWRSIDPPPENLQNVEKGYGAKLMMTYAKHPNLFRRLVDNEFGTVVDGQPVFPEYNAEFHRSPIPLDPLPDYPIYGGLDGGRTPAIIFFQVPGYKRVLKELVVYDPSKNQSSDNIHLERMGPSYFGKLTKEFCINHFGDRDVDTIFYDPSIDFGQEEDGYDWLEFFRKEFPCKFLPGGEEGNRLEPRLEAVRQTFNESPGGNPGILISSDCPVLLRGLAGGYAYDTAKTSVGLTLRKTPVKGPWSHAQDGMQHGFVGYNMRGRGVEKQKQKLIDRRAGTVANRRGQQRFVKTGGYAGARA